MVGEEAVTRYFRRVYPKLRTLPTSGPQLTDPGQRQRLDWVLRSFPPSPPRKVLDAGCGDGAYAVALALRGHLVTAVDISSELLAAAAARAAAAGVSDRVRLVNADLRTWRPRERFDSVLCLGVGEYYVQSAELFDSLFALTLHSLLLSLARRDTGPRALIRRIWLGAHGVRCHFHTPRELETSFEFRNADVTVTESPWTYEMTIVRRHA